MYYVIPSIRYPTLEAVGDEC